MPTGEPFIPEYITVHLGRPDQNARNVTVPFLDYVANVASSEIYPTWPENAIRANMYAQISFALNRIYTEYYRSRGYDFDITSNTAMDQAFVDGRNVFENIKDLAGELFTSYISRQGNVEPLLAIYCDGREVSCEGLSQWGTVELAEQGLSPYEILTYYYGNNIDIVTDAPIVGIQPTAPGRPLRLGAFGDDVRLVQLRLNRISDNFPAIPKIVPVDGFFTNDTEEAVRVFQRTFGLSPDGIVGNSTWYYIRRIYNGVKRLNELDSEGIGLEEVTQQYPQILREGDTGPYVRSLQFYLNYLSGFYDSIPPVEADGIFGPVTRAALIDAQNTFGLVADGILGEMTWQAIYDAYLGILATVPPQYLEGGVVPFSGTVLRLGTTSDEVRVLQEYLNYIAQTFTDLPTMSVTGYFGQRTREAVLAFQEMVGLPANGVVSFDTWNTITELYSDLYKGNRLGEGQYPGYEVGADAQ